MENVNHTQNHRLHITDRNRGSLDGIKSVISFAPEEVKLSTQLGRLTICGENLHVISLDVEKGELEFDGLINSMVYTEEKTAGQVASKIFGRMFK